MSERPQYNDDRFEKSFYNRPMPKSGLQAAELESEDYGKLRVAGRRIEYFDIATKTVFFFVEYQSVNEANMQLRFYRQAYRDVVDRRREMHVVN